MIKHRSHQDQLFYSQNLRKKIQLNEKQLNLFNDVKNIENMEFENSIKSSQPHNNID